MGSLGRDLTHYDTSAFEKVATSTSHVQPQSLPPTSAAAKYHSLRVHYQVQQWKGTVDELLPQEWGWKESDGGLSLSRLTYHQLHWNSYGSSDAPARQTAAA
ncbi:hypothetical protein AAFF_G00084070 [Aldrovandia affinis]|uniref:Uncharacterized protein n=1 Tax=Aldrovandia affinis TaxID=143900 RepID=A0AAD7RWZ7_9TELE|nr:hypothetical protein AAFF_G00084070 [Aldrovandia affinis]